MAAYFTLFLLKLSHLNTHGVLLVAKADAAAAKAKGSAGDLTDQIGAEQVAEATPAKIAKAKAAAAAKIAADRHERKMARARSAAYKSLQGSIKAHKVAIKSKSFEQPLGLTRISLILNTSVNPSDHPIQHSEFFGIFGTRSQTSAFLQFIFLFQKRFEPIDLTFGACGREIITMNTHGKLLSGVDE